MRLQVEVHRHTLPQVNIVFNTSSRRNTVNTISELLAALDRIIPLESSDGEWGLEDYIVEVAATSDQTNVYECLHYQLVKDVLREDDEVIIRGLTTDEIRERRQGGRLQILPDGRHLFDGVAWGRRYNVRAHRPGIEIPPRKRRRLLMTEEEPVQEEESSSLILANSAAQVGNFVDNEDTDEDEDEDYEYSDDDDDNDNEASDEADERPLQIVARQEFDDADLESDAEDSHSDPDNVPAAGLDEDEIQLLLREAEEIEDSYNSLPLEFRITSPPRKRKRTEPDEFLVEDTTFEGFSSPVKQKTSLESVEQVDGVITGKTGDQIVVEPLDDDLNGDLLIKRTGVLKTNLTNGSILESDVHQEHAQSEEGSDSADNTSSSEESDSDSESNSDSSEESTDDASSSSDSDGTSSDSESGSDSEDTSSSDGSESDVESESAVSLALNGSSSKSPKLSSGKDSEPTIKVRVDNPPGTGTKRTRANNLRGKLRKRLARLKEQEILPQEADFETLRAYENGQELQADITTEDQSSLLSSELARRKEEMLARFSAVYENETATVASKVDDAAIVESDFVKAAVEVPDSQTKPQDVATLNTAQDPVDPPPTNGENLATTKSPQKRARLDIESSRRMLFSSLGLRNPKTPAAEQALREKLSKPTRDVQTRPVEQVKDKAPSNADDNSWKEKLIISAVECVQEGVVLSPPPFPFKQRWERGGRGETTGSSDRYHQARNEHRATETNTEAAQPPLIIPKSLTDSRTISTGTANMDDIPRPTDLESYPHFTQNDIHVGAVVAYKHLQINHKFEPEESPYRVARITSLNSGETGDMIEFLLSKKDRELPKPSDSDNDTSEKIYNKFEMPVDEEEYDDNGFRELTFDELIRPRLIQPAEVQVPSSDRNKTSEATDTQMDLNPTVIPESGPVDHAASDESDRAQVGIDTPRKNEIANIIQDAGFNSALDEQLLQPIDIPKDHGAKESSSRTDVFKPLRKNGALELKRKYDGAALLDPSSPPSVSMVETVDYPQVSQIDGNHSSILDPNASSSHQDAQRVSPDVSPDVSDIEHSNLSRLKVRSLNEQEDEASQTSSLPSEVPLSQLNGTSSSKQDAKNRDDTESQLTSIRLRGGQADSGSEYEIESDEADSDGLPSLRQLTSSQNQRTGRTTSGLNPLSQSQPRISSRPQRGDQKPSNSSEQDVAESQNPEPEIKISASQRPALAMSQIPSNTKIVDLTLSSDPVNPSDNEDDSADKSPRALRRRARNIKVEGSQSQGDYRHSTRSTTTTSTKGKKRDRGRSDNVWKSKSWV